MNATSAADQAGDDEDHTDDADDHDRTAADVRERVLDGVSGAEVERWRGRDRGRAEHRANDHGGRDRPPSLRRQAAVRHQQKQRTQGHGQVGQPPPVVNQAAAIPPGREPGSATSAPTAYP